MKPAPDYDTKKVYFIALTSSLGSFNWGYHLAIFNSLRIFLHNNVFPDSSSQDIAFIASSLTLGAAFGSLASVKLVTSLGRRRTLLISDFLAIIGTFFTMINDIQTIYIGRTIIGFSIGVSSSVVSLYNVEMAPLEKKGITSGISMILLSFGMLIGYLAGFLVPNTYEGNNDQIWKTLFGFPILINTLRASIFMRFLKFDTPFYLVLQGKMIEAKMSLRQIYTNNIDYHLEKELRDKEASTSSSGNLKFLDLFTQKYRKAFLMGMLLITGIQLCGFGPIFVFFSEFVKQSANNNEDTLVIFSTFLGLTSFISTLITTLIIERFGRKPLLIFGMLGAACIKILYVAFSILGGSDHTILKYLLVFWPIFFRLSTGTLAFVYISEVLPGVGVTFASFTNWAWGFATLQTFLPLVDFIGIEIIMMLYALFCIFSAIIYKKYLIESKGKTKAELLGLYNGNFKEDAMGKVCFEMRKLPLLRNILAEI